MTTKRVHCPFCANNCEHPHITGFGASFYCDNCNSAFMVLEDDYWKKAHGGTCTKYYEPCDMKGCG